jgi:hypothetical protein
MAEESGLLGGCTFEECDGVIITLGVTQGCDREGLRAYFVFVRYSVFGNLFVEVVHC